MDGVGAFAGALLMAALARPAWYARLYLGGLTLYLLMVTGFAVAPNATVAGAALLLVGFGQSGFSIMQATLVYLLAPAEVRTRVLGLLSVCIGLGPIGFLALGLAGRCAGRDHGLRADRGGGVAGPGAVLAALACDPGEGRGNTMTDLTIREIRTTLLQLPWADDPWLFGHALGGSAT